MRKINESTKAFLQIYAYMLVLTGLTYIGLILIEFPTWWILFLGWISLSISIIGMALIFYGLSKATKTK